MYMYMKMYISLLILGASFTKQGKLVQEHNFKTAPIGVEISSKLKYTDTTSHLHIDQCNIPSAAQFSVVANKE